MADESESRPCIFCFGEIVHPDIWCSGKTDSESPEQIGDSSTGFRESSTVSAVPDAETVRKVGRPEKDIGEFDDPVSSGRKRAAVIAPIAVGDVCEWAYLRFAGGGTTPIEGCLGNPATDRHHGPDKSTLNNELGVNLHRICSYCHNRWHSANDKTYTEPRPADNGEWLPNGECAPHNSTAKMTKAEALMAEMMRTGKR